MIRSRLASAVLIAGLVALPASAGEQLSLVSVRPLAAREEPADPTEEIEFFEVDGAAGTLVLPAGAPDRLTPAVVILRDGLDGDSRAAVYTDQLLGAGLAVLEVLQLPENGLDSVVSALARHSRLLGQPRGMLGFGAGARLAATYTGPIAARALLYPGCNGIAPLALRGQAVLIMHGGADTTNLPEQCEFLAAALAQAGASVRLRVFERASYAWDRHAFPSEGRAILPSPDGTGLVYSEAWPALAVLSASEVAGFFASSLSGRRQ